MNFSYAISSPGIVLKVGEVPPKMTGIDGFAWSTAKLAQAARAAARPGSGSGLKNALRLASFQVSIATVPG